MGAVIPNVADMKQPYTIYGSGSFISEFRDSMRQEMLNYYTNLPSYLTNPKTPDESFKQKPIEIMKGNELDITITDRNRSYGDSRVYRYKINGESVLRFEQIPYPECCGIAIIKNFSANSNMSKSDFLDAMDQFLADIKKNDRYSKVLFYTASGNVGERLFSMINGITILDPFRNKRSGNTLVGFEIDLLEKESRDGWHSLDLDDEESDEEETDGEHDEEEEEEDNDPFGLMPDILPLQAQPEVVRGERPRFGSGGGILGQIIPTNGNSIPTPRGVGEIDPWYDDSF